MRRTLLCLFAAVGIACGAESPTVPPVNPNPQATAIPIFSLRNGEPVSGAQVTVNNGVVTTLAPGFLPRTGWYQSGEFLWPRDDQLPDWFTYQIVYNDDYNEGGRSLHRPEPGLMTVIPAELIWEEQELFRAVQSGIDNLNDADDDIEWQMARSSSGADGEISIEINPEDPWFIELPGAGGLAIAALRGNTIIGGRVVFRSAEYGSDWVTGATAHELGHLRGLGHVKDPETVMGSFLHQFSEREREVMRYMMRRPPGTRWPDDTTGVASAASKRPTLRLVCVF